MMPVWLTDFLMIIHLPLVGGVGWLVYREMIKDYQHKMIWQDYKKRHNIPNGDN